MASAVDQWFGPALRPNTPRQVKGADLAASI